MNKNKNKKTNKYKNVLLTEDGLFFVDDKTFIREKLKYDNMCRQKGGDNCDKMVNIDPCEKVREFLNGIVVPINFIMKIIPSILNKLILSVNKIIRIMGEILDSIIMVINKAINNPINIINFIIKQLKMFLELLLSVLRGNPLKIAVIIILPYVYTAANFILTNLYVFPLGYFGSFFRMFIGFILGREWNDTKIVGLTLNDAIKTSTYVIICIYVACYYSFFKLIYDL